MGEIAWKKGAPPKAARLGQKFQGRPQICVPGTFILNAHANSSLHFVAQAD
jgi:hypothetical protein